jgi:putative transposase
MSRQFSQMTTLRQGYNTDGLIRPSGLPITIETEHTVVDQVRIVPRNGHYVVEVIYTKEPIQANVDPSFCIGIDLGVTNLAAIASNREGFVPRLINGRPIKAWNQWYNKRMKELIGTVIIGKNPLWKQETGMGKRNKKQAVKRTLCFLEL